ncbi:PD-(D/E)XK nuclease family protein [Acinetobacter defluvii]|uniref:PD-(D/E)XK nuclease family protein n=1 Tax=Acinetobacter defluvii TaxID=1871111 RepID=UPI003AF98D05
MTENLLQKYENLLLKAQQYKVPEKEATFFDTAFRKHHENPTTELLNFFLDQNENHDLDDVFYQGFIQTIKDANTDFENFNFGRLEALGREEITQDNKRIDLWIETQHALIIVEVKIRNEQNNPIDDYSAWAENRVLSNAKKIVKIVLNIDGQSNFSEWLGISFQALANHIRLFLAQKSLNIGLSKWVVFARDFLLHLDNFYKLEVINVKLIDFVVKNHVEIQKLFKIREQAYEELKNHILKVLQEAFTDNQFSVANENRFKNIAKGWRFSCSNLDTDSDIVLYINFDESPIVEVWLCFELPQNNQSVKNKLDSTLKNKNTLLKNNINWFKSDEDSIRFSNYRSICWEFNDFNLDEISKLIIYIQQTINNFDA